jgi:signal recognition particle subunit SRP54
MFDRLTERLDDAFRKLRGQGRLSDRDLDDSLREIRRALLEADVNFDVARSFLKRVREQAVGREVLRSLTPGQQVIKIVHDELVSLLGGDSAPLAQAERPPTVILLVGLQGCGKTTAAAKLASHLQGRNRPPFLVGADVYRPAAFDQLRTLADGLSVPAFGGPSEGNGDPVEICRQGVERARSGNRSAVILDTAGRLAIDDEMMDELTAVRSATEPDEVLFVADAMLGQDAVETAGRFCERLEFTGCILTKMDGDARGGAALSIREVTGRPVKFIAAGEGVEALEPFHPQRVASRILGMGDVVSLVEKAQQAFDQGQARKMEARLRQNAFTFDDFREQLRAIRKMGPLDQLLGMIPGAGKALREAQVDDKAFVQVEAIINSMTRAERVQPLILNGSRRRRIARGSGTKIQDVNRLLKQFQAMQKMMRQVNRPGRGRGAAARFQLPAAFG